MMEAQRQAGDRDSHIVKVSLFTLAALLLMGIFALFAIPEMFDDLITFGGLQLRYALVIMFFAVVAYSLSVRRVAIREHIYLCIVIFLTLLMTVIGILQRGQVIFEWRILGYDLFVLGGYICGMLLTLNQSAWRMMRLIRVAYLVWLAGLLLDSMLLSLGIIPPVWVGDRRVHVWAEFFCIEGMLLALPYLIQPCLQHGPKLLRGRFLVLIGLVTIVTVNVAMGSRSVLIQVFTAGLFCLPLYARRLPRTLLYSAVLLLAIGIGVVAQYSSAISGNYAVQRLQQTDVQDEERTVEIGFLLNYIGWHAVFGLGNGSGFPSPTTRPGEDFAAYPHLSIFTPLQKGGVPAMVVLVFCPLAMLLMVLFHRGASALQQQAATSALLSMLYSCLSGTWVFPLWVFFGIAVGYCFYGKSSMARKLEARVEIVGATS